MQYFTHLLWYLLLGFILVFPLVNFKIHLTSPIFPAVEIGIIYYLICNFNFAEWKILIAGLLIDQMYGLPTGSSSLVLLINNILLKYKGWWVLVKHDLIHFIAFCGYAAITLICRYLIFVSLKQYPSLFELCFQCLTTIFSYPILKSILDRFWQYSKVSNAK